MFLPYLSGSNFLTKCEHLPQVIIALFPPEPRVFSVSCAFNYWAVFISHSPLVLVLDKVISIPQPLLMSHIYNPPKDFNQISLDVF